MEYLRERERARERERERGGFIVTGASVLLLLLWRCGDEADITVIVVITATITMIVMIRALHCRSAVSLSPSLPVAVFLTLTCTTHACEITNNSKNTIFSLSARRYSKLNPSVLHIGNSNMAAAAAAAAGRMHRRHQINIHQKSPGWRQPELLLCAIHMLASSQGWKSLLLNNKMCIKINEKSVKEEREMWKKQGTERRQSQTHELPCLPSQRH